MLSLYRGLSQDLSSSLIVGPVSAAHLTGHSFTIDHLSRVRLSVFRAVDYSPSKALFMHLAELKKKTPADLLAYAEELQIENASSMRKQDIMFAIL